MHKAATLVALGLASILSIGCGEEEADERQVEIPFRAVVGAEPFACGRSYAGLGTTGSTWTPKDFRMYLHGLHLIAADGREVPITLVDDGAWQGEGVALLDFEDQSGGCVNGTAGTNTLVKGTVPEGDYKGLRFTLGVPFELNHKDASVAEPPLNVSALFWSWRGGYLFLRIDGTTTGLPGHSIHVGSTGCDMPEPNVVTRCDEPNRVEYRFDDFELGKSEVVLDVAALVAGSDLDTNTPDTGVGCQASPTDPDCAPLFERLGLPFNGTAGDPSAQAFVRVE